MKKLLVVVFIILGVVMVSDNSDSQIYQQRIDLKSPGPIGSVTPSTIQATTVSATTITATGGFYGPGTGISGLFDRTAPGAIGEVTPSTGRFTVVTATESVETPEYATTKSSGVSGTVSMYCSNSTDTTTRGWAGYTGTCSSSYWLDLPDTAPTVDQAMVFSAASGTHSPSTMKPMPGTVTYPLHKCTTALAVTASSDWPIERFDNAVTITKIVVYQKGATDVVGGLDECTGTNGACSTLTAIDSDITGTSEVEARDDTSLTNASIAAGNRVYWHTTSVTGTNEYFEVCFYYTIN